LTFPGVASRVTRLAGFDTAGEPFTSGDRLFRGIYRGNAGIVRRVLRVCEENDLFSHGLVATRELAENPFPELDYEIVLEHERIPFISYPHEWSASMFKEAALMHVALFERLQEHGLTLKDWHPLNILFSGTRPVFVDFTSIVPIESLPEQQHLRAATPPRWFGDLWDDTSKAVYEMYRLMYDPYFGLPLAMMDRGHHARARQRIYETTLNTGDDYITRREVFGESLVSRLMYEIDDRMLRLSLRKKGNTKPAFFRRIRRSIARQKAALKGSAYSSYYEDKNEAFAAEPNEAWTNKQHGVHKALTALSPATVLDVGSNTGWFSMLAAKLGSSVVAVDLDEASIDRLFADARREQLDILPLVVNLVRPLPPLAAKVFPDEPSLSLIGEGAPVISQPDSRFQCEMVLALALVHHLALGQSHPFDEIAAIFARLATKYLCVEFVDLRDPMITSDRAFFPAYNASPDSFTWYSKENFIAALGWHFDRIEEIPSYPESRTLLLCHRTQS
jgi:SAM-dependent methyltransferase